MPLILRLAKRNHGDGAGECALGLGIGVTEDDAKSMGIVVVFVDDEERPLAIGADDGVGGYKHVACWVFDIAGGAEEAMLDVCGLHPLLGDELRGKVLGRFTLG